MKLDVIIGNPPYQDNDGGGLGSSATSMYDKFMQRAENIGAGIIAFIVPMRWLTISNAKGIDADWRVSELCCDKYRELHYWEKSQDIFKEQRIKGGIMYYIKDQAYKGVCKVYRNDVYTGEMKLNHRDFGVFIPSLETRSILDKVWSQSESCAGFDSLILKRNPFGLESGWHGKAEDKEGKVKIYDYLGITYASNSDIVKNTEIVGIYKVLIQKAFGEGIKAEKIPEPIIAKPGEACTETYLVIAPSENEQECKNVASYMGTEIFNMLLHIKKSTQNTASDAYSCIPLVDFNQTWTDTKIAELFGLSELEVDHIHREVT